MKKRNLIVLKADLGITFNCINGPDGELIIRASNINNLENYKNPPIPEGYKHFEGSWDNGFVIKRKSDESQFIWIPVGYLEYDGILFNEISKDNAVLIILGFFTCKSYFL